MTCDHVTKACFSISVGAWLACLLWLVVREPWAGVFGTGACMGWVLMGSLQLTEDKQALKQEIRELEKQVIVLRSRLSELGHEAHYRRAALQSCPSRLTHSKSV